MKKINYLDKFKGTLIGVAIGDTLGQPFEGWLREKILAKVQDFGEFLKANKKNFKTYTDDTQLTLHTARALIEGSGFNFDYFIREYVNWLDDPPIGPGYGCLSSIQKLKYGISWQNAASNSGGNGTLMRIAPIGLYYCKDVSELKKAAYNSSIITHAHPAASAGAIVIARAVSYLVEIDPLEGFDYHKFMEILIKSISDSNESIWDEFIEILKKVENTIGIDLESGIIKFSQIGVKTPYFIEQYLGKAFVHPYAISTVACALFIFLSTLQSFEKCIYALAGAGGDSDTIGAVGGSLAGAYFGFDNISSELINLVKKKSDILEIARNLYLKFEEKYLNTHFKSLK
jgi:ADP-ribosyl-[dinitrogen reductase] hydrolase